MATSLFGAREFEEYVSENEIGVRKYPSLLI